MGCRRRAPKAELVRLVASGDRLAVDGAGTRPGRGAYVCSDVGCLRSAARKGRLARALRAPVAADAVEPLVEGFATKAMT